MLLVRYILSGTIARVWKSQIKVNLISYSIMSTKEYNQFNNQVKTGSLLLQHLCVRITWFWLPFEVLMLINKNHSNYQRITSCCIFFERKIYFLWFYFKAIKIFYPDTLVDPLLLTRDSKTKINNIINLLDIL